MSELPRPIAVKLSHIMEACAIKQCRYQNWDPLPKTILGAIGLRAKFPTPSANRRETLPNDGK